MGNRTQKSKMPQSPNQSMLRRTLFLMTACGIVAFIVLVGRLYYMQVVQHSYYENLAVEQQVRQTNISASRGTIYDKNMKILAMSANVDSIFISPAEIEVFEEDRHLIAKGLSDILGVDYEKIMEMTEDTKSWYKTVAKKVEQDVADEIRAFKNEHNLKGIKIEADTKRYYPQGSLASHVIGYVGTDNYGLAGVELKYNELLEGSNGRIVRAKNSAGTDMLFTKFEDYYDAENGNDVVLSIDSTIQHYLEKTLSNAVADYGVKNGAMALAMDVNTGGVLGMVSLGNFDLNAYQDVSAEVQEILDQTEDEAERAEIRSDAQKEQWRNKTLTETYEPGSTFKILTLAMALEEGVTSKNDTFYCGGQIGVLGRTTPVKCWKTIGHGSQTLTQSVQHSCNVAFVNLGLRIGAERFYEYARNFGLFDYTGIDLAEENTKGLWWPESTFYNPENLSQLAAASFGQTFKITPMQLITAVSACANGGYLMEPYVVESVQDADGNVVKAHEPRAIRQVISEETSAQVCEILESVVGDPVEGTGKNAYVAGYRIGGKTGTSTDTEKEAQTGEKEYKVSFIGIAPADDPQIAILVILDNPTNASVYVSGGQMAAPTVGKIFSDVLPYMGIEPHYDENEVLKMDKTVPSVVTLSIDDAKKYLEEAGLTARIEGEGDKVVAQIPHANAVVAPESQIILYTEGQAPKTEVIMPDLSQLTYEAAKSRLAYYGLFIRVNGGAMPDDGNMVVATQGIAAGTTVEYGTVIDVSLIDNQNLGRY